MAQLRASATLLLLFLALHSAFSADLPADSSPSPAPEVGADTTNSPISLPPANSPAPSPDTSSPPVTEVSDSSSPSPSPSALLSPPADSYENSPSPSPTPEAHFRAADSVAATTSEEEGSSGGMSGGKKFGIVMGVLIGAGVVVFAGIVYKKRQENIRRSQYGYATRRGLI